MTEWWQSVLRFANVDGTVVVTTPWYRETYVPTAVIKGGDRGLFLTMETDLLGETVVRFAVGNGFAQYRVDGELPELWDTHHAYGVRVPVTRLRLSKARKTR